MSKKQVAVDRGKIIEPSFPNNSILSNDSRAKFSFSEKGKTYIANNAHKQIGCCLKIDNGLYSEEVKKCDFGLLIQDGRFFLIELKGADVNSACKQLLETLKSLENGYSSFIFDFFCRIVAKKGTPGVNTNRQRLEKYLVATSSNKKFLSRETEFTEDI